MDNLISLMDLPPTVLDAAGIDIPDYMRGRPLQNLVDGKDNEWPEEVFVQISENICGRSIRTDQWKYSVVAPEKSGMEPGSDYYKEHFSMIWKMIHLK